jgi:hypothetical protein
VELLAQSEATTIGSAEGVERRWTPPPVDTSALVRRGQELARAHAAPVVPALCLRLVGYARSFRPVSEHARVEDWAAACYRRWLDQLAGGDAAAVESTIATDPANLLLGAKALHEPALAAECIHAQFDLYEHAQVRLPRLNQTVLGSLLEPGDPPPARALLADPLPPPDLLAQASPVSLAALGLLSRRTGMATVVPEPLMAALAFRSVWMRDLPGVGLTLLAAALLRLPIPTGLLAWIARIARDDGFLGMWELYADPHPVANLLGTVNIYWGLSAAAAAAAAPDGHRSRGHVNPEPEAPTRSQLEKAISQAQRWLDRHDDRFSLLPACRDEEHFESTFKPFVELAVLCHVLTRPRHAGSAHEQWARRTAERLSPHVEWQGLIEAFRLQTSATLGLGIYPLLQSATGRPCRFTSEARELVADPFANAQERTPMRELDYQFTRALMGLPMSLPLRDQLSRSLLRAPFDPTLMDTDALYDLTHIVFYATRFGCVPWTPPADIEAAWPVRALESMSLGRLLMGDADLGAELLMVELYTGHADGAMRARCLSLLVDAQMPDGSFLGPEGRDADSDEFGARYHTTLVATAALADSLMWPPA